MPYRFEPGRIYRMPTHFRPAPGQRQIPAEANADPTRSPRNTLVSASFLTEASALERHIPERFALASEPVVTIEFHYMTEIDRLAGRGYTMIQSLVAGHIQWRSRSSRRSLPGSDVGKSHRPDHYGSWGNRAAQTLRGHPGGPADRWHREGPWLLGSAAERVDGRERYGENIS